VDSATQENSRLKSRLTGGQPREWRQIRPLARPIDAASGPTSNPMRVPLAPKQVESPERVPVSPGRRWRALEHQGARAAAAWRSHTSGARTRVVPSGPLMPTARACSRPRAAARGCSAPGHGGERTGGRSRRAGWRPEPPAAQHSTPGSAWPPTPPGGDWTARRAPGIGRPPRRGPRVPGGGPAPAGPGAAPRRRPARPGCCARGAARLPDSAPGVASRRPGRSGGGPGPSHRNQSPCACPCDRRPVTWPPCCL